MTDADDIARRKKRRRDEPGMSFRELIGYSDEGPLPPRPHRSGVGGWSTGPDGKPIGPGWPGSGSVWSASDAAANGMTLSNGGLTVTSATGWKSIRGSISKSSGKLYFEVLAGAGVADLMVGLADAGFSPAAFLGNNPQSAGLASSGVGANFVSGGFTSNYYSGYPATSGDVIGIAVDFSAGSVWLSRNNAWVNGSNPGAGTLPELSFTLATTGALFPAMAFLEAGEVWTLQSTAASQKYAPPAGFSAWDAGAAPAHSAQALAYLARTTGGNEGGNATNIATLIDGLVSDGVWSKLDALYILAQQNAADSLLNLVSASYSLATNGVFTAYQGYNGFTGSGMTLTGYDPSGGGLQFKQNNASLGIWAYAWFSDPAGQIGTNNGTSGIYDGYSGAFYPRVNAPSTPSVTTNPSTNGLYAGDRSLAASLDGYCNGVNLNTLGGTSTVPDPIFFIGAGGSPPGLTAQKLSAAFIGASLGAAGQLALYNRLKTYMDAVAGHSAQALAYLARTTGGNEGGNGENIATLIDGLVADGVWAKLDALYVLAQQNQADARLNLIGTSYPLTGSATFTAYQGFSAFSGTGLDTGFNAATAPSPKFVQNNANVGVWSLGLINASEAEIGNNVVDLVLATDYTGLFLARINSSTFVSSTATVTHGLLSGDRADAINATIYQNGASFATGAAASQAVFNGDITIGYVPSIGLSVQSISAAFIGASLGAAGQLALYNRLRTYMTAIGVP